MDYPGGVLASVDVVPKEVLPNTILLHEDAAQYWPLHHEFYLVPSANCKQVYDFLRSQPVEQGWMTIRFHTIFTNYCISVFDIAANPDSTLTPTQTMVYVMLKKVPTDVEEFIQCLKLVYTMFITAEQPLCLANDYGLTRHSYYARQALLYRSVFSEVERRIHLIRSVEFLESLYDQVEAAKKQAQNSEVMKEAWIRIVSTAEAGNFDMKALADALSEAPSETKEANSAAGLLNAIRILQLDDGAQKKTVKDRLLLPGEELMSLEQCSSNSCPQLWDE